MHRQYVKFFTAILYIFVSAQAYASTQEGKFDYLKGNDLRDVAKHDKNLAGTSAKILQHLAKDPAYLSGADVNFRLKKSGEISAMGPLGHYKTGSDGKQYFNVTNTRADRRKNVVLGTWYESAADRTGEDRIFDIELTLFIHSSEGADTEEGERGHYFRRVAISVDWTEKVDGLPKLELKNVISEIPLNDTDFEYRVEVATQKIIMFDNNHGITKVAPVTLGAIDARTDLDGVVNTMSLLLPGSSGKYKDFNFNEAVVMKRNFWNNGGNQNSASRKHPAYYKGRPFLGIVDRSRVTGLIQSEEGQYVMAPAHEVKYSSGYRQIGFHYQIKDGGLVRGFKSHGCLRLQDHDLYILDDILNYGPKDFIPVEVTAKLDPKFDEVDSVYKRLKAYDKVVYSRLESSRTVKCENKPSYPVRFFGGYHTVADSDCLSLIANSSDSISEIVAYLKGESNFAPSTLIWRDAQHIPVQKAEEELEAETPVVYAYYPVRLRKIFNKNRRAAAQTNLRNYNIHCVRKETPNPSCGRLYNALRPFMK